jgi:hypothetical protein
MILDGKVQPVHSAKKVATICEPTVSQPYRPPQLLTAIVLPFFFLLLHYLYLVESFKFSDSLTQVCFFSKNM